MAPTIHQIQKLRAEGLNDFQIAERYKGRCSAIEFLSVLVDSGGNGTLANDSHQQIWVFPDKETKKPRLVTWQTTPI